MDDNTPAEEPNVPATPMEGAATPPPAAPLPAFPASAAAAMTTSAAPGGPPLKRRNVVGVWIGLPLITLGFYAWYWWPRINSELRSVDSSIRVNGLGVWAAMFLGGVVIVPPFISVYNTGKRIGQAQQTAGVGSSCNPVIGIVLMFVFGLTTLYYQSELNKIADLRS